MNRRGDVCLITIEVWHRSPRANERSTHHSTFHVSGVRNFSTAPLVCTIQPRTEGQHRANIAVVSKLYYRLRKIQHCNAGFFQRSLSREHKELQIAVAAFGRGGDCQKYHPDRACSWEGTAQPRNVSINPAPTPIETGSQCLLHPRRLLHSLHITPAYSPNSRCPRSLRHGRLRS